MAPSWRLLAKFGEEVEFPGPLLTTQVCPCSYCWCGKCGTQRLPQAVFRSLFSAEARVALLETLGGDDVTGGDGESEGSASSNLTETEINDSQNLNGSCSGTTDVRELPTAAEETRQTAEQSSAQLGKSLQASTLDSAAISDSATTTEESSEDEDDQSSSASLKSSDLSGGESRNFTRQNDSINSTANFSFRRKKKAMQSTFLYVRISHWAAKIECGQCERTFIRNSSFVAHAATHAENLANITRLSRRSDVIGHQRNSLASLSGFEFHRRLSALQSTFVDVSAANETYQSEKQSQKLRNTVPRTWDSPTGKSSNSVSHQKESKRRLLCRQSRMFIKKQVSTFGCSYCNRSFMKRGNLMIHMRMHMKIRPFRCTFGKCSRQFTSATALEAHARTAHFERTNLSFSAAASNSNTHENSKTRLDNRKSQKSEKADKLQCDIKNNSLDTSLINQESFQNTWSNEIVEVEAVKNVTPAGREPLKNQDRLAGPIERQVLQRVEDQAGRLSMDTSIGDQLPVNRSEEAPVGEITQSAASPEAPKLGISSGSSTPVVDSLGRQTAHEPMDVNLVPVCISDTTKPGLSEEIPKFSLRPVIHEIVTEADETKNRRHFDRTEAVSDSSFNAASSAVVCVHCSKPLATKNAEHENSKSSNGNLQQTTGSLMYCPACGTCQLDFPNVIAEASEDPVPIFDDSQDADGDDGPHVDSQEAESCANSKPRRKSLRLYELGSASRKFEESLESSDEDDNADDPAWTEPENETEDSEESTEDGGDSDDDDNAAAASTHELSVIPEKRKENQSDEDKQADSVPGQSRQQNVGKKVPNEKRGKRKFWCLECAEGFEARATLNLHLRDHDPVLPFKCGLCTARFETRKKYFIHLKSHKDQNGRFNCNQCEYSTKKSDHIVKHLRVHSGQKLYTCDGCEKAFNELSNLTAHKRVHNGEKPYECDVCKMAFKQSHVLKDHKRIHSGERPYKCDACKQDFKQAAHLKDHKRIHSGEKPFKCPKCSRRFTQKTNLQTHQKVVHPKNRANQQRNSQ